MGLLGLLILLLVADLARGQTLGEGVSLVERTIRIFDTPRPASGNPGLSQRLSLLPQSGGPFRVNDAADFRAPRHPLGGALAPNTESSPYDP